MKTEVFCTFRFESAHSLPHLPADHKCHNLHGHSYRVIVTLEGPVVDGWVLDYARLVDLWDERVNPFLDHKILNDAPGFGPDYATTSENVAAWIAGRLTSFIPMPVVLVSVEVWETADFGARWTR